MKQNAARVLAQLKLEHHFAFRVELPIIKVKTMNTPQTLLELDLRPINHFA
ncbi:MAG: hypothetical protein ABI210_14170 [Abditibacteriaceae bacterium]